jgi:polyphosphate kinase
VDRFLEHSRVYYFENAGAPEVWLSSADWMTRNLTRRIELMCPILDEKLKQVIIRLLQLLLNDNVKARQLLPNGKYKRVEFEPPSIRSQFEMQPILEEKYLLSESVTIFGNNGIMIERI